MFVASCRKAQNAGVLRDMATRCTTSTVSEAKQGVGVKLLLKKCSNVPPAQGRPEIFGCIKEPSNRQFRRMKEATGRLLGAEPVWSL